MPFEDVQPDKLNERAAAFYESAKILCASRAFSHLTFLTSLQSFQVVSEVYFFLNGAYKAERIPPNSKTKSAKVAAITALSVVTLPPSFIHF